MLHVDHNYIPNHKVHDNEPIQHDKPAQHISHASVASKQVENLFLLDFVSMYL